MLKHVSAAVTGSWRPPFSLYRRLCFSILCSRGCCTGILGLKRVRSDAIIVMLTRCWFSCYCLVWFAFAHTPLCVFSPTAYREWDEERQRGRRWLTYYVYITPFDVQSMHRSLSGSPGDFSYHTERMRWDGRISQATRCRNIPAIWNSSKSTDSNGCSFRISLQIAMKGYFKRTCEELSYTLLCVRDLINLLSKWYLLHDNQTILRWTAHGLFTDAYCTHKKQDLAEIASSDLIGWYYTSSGSLMLGERSAFKVQGWGRIYFPGCHIWISIFYMFSFFS